MYSSNLQWPEVTTKQATASPGMRCQLQVNNVASSQHARINLAIHMSLQQNLYHEVCSITSPHTARRHNA